MLNYNDNVVGVTFIFCSQSREVKTVSGGENKQSWV